MRRPAGALTAIMVAGSMLTACTSGGGASPGDRDLTDDALLSSSLVAHEGCEDLREYFVEHALDIVGPYGLGGHGPHHAGVDDVAESEEADAAASDGEASAGAAPVEGRDFSGTNVQEADVDEPDHVKTDGERLLALAGNRLHVLDVTGPEPAPIGEVELDDLGGQEMLLDGDHALILSRGHALPEPLDHGGVGASGAVSSLSLVDLGGGTPQITETLELDGAYVSARMVDGVARIVVRTQPVGLEFTTPDGSGLRAEREATEHNRQVIRDSTIDNWLPYYVYERVGGTRSEGLLLDCADVHHPEAFAGLGLAAVVSVDPADGLDPLGSSGVVGAGETVYASTEHLYVATQRWADQAPDRDGARRPEELTTELHQFAIDQPDAPYVASGQVPGRLLNQWALSEHDGDLRVATTEGDPWGPGEGPGASESAVRVLRRNGSRLQEIGAVTGLGEGERIYAVRYSGDLGYVVTFRETDPLYTVDLSDPTEPRVRGELKILGYSSYLHPLGDDLLLGVGQDADEEGRTRGTQVSVFDVSDLSAPTRLHQETIPDAHSPVEHDHRALLHWAATDLTVLPVQQWTRPVEPAREMDPKDNFVGAVAYRAGADGITEVARISHPDQGPHGPMVQRSLVVGDALYTVSQAGVLASDLETFEDRNWVAF